MFSRWMYCQISSSVQLDKGNTRIDSPLCLRALYSFHNSGRWFFGSQRCCAVRNEKIRSLARDFSSSRRAPPKATSKPCLSSACFSPSVLVTSVWMAEPCTNGLMSFSMASGLTWVNSFKPSFSTIWSRKVYISLNLKRVSTCNSGKGGREG